MFDRAATLEIEIAAYPGFIPLALPSEIPGGEPKGSFLVFARTATRGRFGRGLVLNASGGRPGAGAALAVSGLQAPGAHDRNWRLQRLTRRRRHLDLF